MRGALSSSMMATDLADYLVRKGVSFREAHGAVGQLVRECESRRCELHALPLSTFSNVHPLFTQDVLEALSPYRSVERRDVEGGTAPRAVRAQLDAAKAALAVTDPVERRREPLNSVGNSTELRARG
jgi:argininosuccinate lyase